MFLSEGSEILRVAVLSGVLGFAGFCISYGLYVWRKRNAANRAPVSTATRLARAIACLGCLTLALAWAFNEFRGRNGIACGSDVFVVNAHRETFAQQITAAGTVAQGDVVAEFFSPADRARLAAIDLQILQAEAKKEAIANNVIQPDEALLQEQSHLRSELLQNRGFAFQLKHSRYEAERGRAELTTTWTREESKLLEDLAENEQEFGSALGHREITRRALQRADELQKQGNISHQQLDARSSDDLSAALNVEKSKQAITALKERRVALSHRFDGNLASLDRQISELSTDYAQMAAMIDDLDGKLDKLRLKLPGDHDRAVFLRQREVDAVGYEIAILAAEKIGAYDCITAQMIARARRECVVKAPRPKGFASNNAVRVKVRSGSQAAMALPVPGVRFYPLGVLSFA
jgi:hypothetical protein